MCIHKIRTGQKIVLDSNRGAAMREHRDHSVCARCRKGPGFENDIHGHIGPVKIIEPCERARHKNLRRLEGRNLRMILSPNVRKIGQKRPRYWIIISSDDEQFARGRVFWNPIDNSSKRTQRSFNQDRSTADDPALRKTACNLIGGKPWLAKIREDGMYTDICIGG